MTINRRDFLQLGAGICLASALPHVSVNADETDLLEITQIRIPLGLKKPFKAIHVSDTHLTYADERDNQRKRDLAKARGAYFKFGDKWLNAALAYARQNDELFIHTGDLIDFVSVKNLEAVQEKFRGVDCFVSSGNHEFSQYVGEAKEDEAYKAQSFDRVQQAYPNDLRFCSRVINGVNFVALDDVYYYFSPEQLTQFKAEVAKGLPIVMRCHCPLHTPELFDFMTKGKKEPCAYTVGVPVELMANYGDHRREQQKPNAATVEFIRWLKEQPLVKAILCGHLHSNWSGPFSQHTMQYVVGGNFSPVAYEVTFE